jgi:ribosomal protein S18 acetylase RimI-like enzyme
MARPSEQLAPRRSGAEPVGFRCLSADAEATRQIPAAVGWVHEASQPFFDWVMGDRAVALRTLERWMHRPSSEVYIERTVLLGDSEPVGGFIPISGVALRQCRQADALAAALAVASRQRPRMLERLAAGRQLFPDVPPDALYLSRMGVPASARRHGRGRAIVQCYLELGRRQGFRRFMLDVWSGNAAAFALYRSLGFRPSSENHAPRAGMTYVRMAREGTRGSSC